MKITIFTWGIEGGAFARLITSLCKGMEQYSDIETEILYIKKGSVSGGKSSARVKYTWLGVSKSRYAVFNLVKYIIKEKPDYFISLHNFLLSLIIACKKTH